LLAILCFNGERQGGASAPHRVQARSYSGANREDDRNIYNGRTD